MNNSKILLTDNYKFTKITKIAYILQINTSINAIIFKTGLPALLKTKTPPQNYGGVKKYIKQ